MSEEIQKKPEALFTFVRGDDLRQVIDDAAEYVRKHGVAVAVVYGPRAYEIHPSNTSEPALDWIMGEMRKRAANDQPEGTEEGALSWGT